ncbi:uncharacterized protein LOC142610366 isoform X2 [Castanea sativa]|uniref:uncharacterized protein LOC142610366 isoform X2 n=1 Tax=Castanea sativa TaxID=21020 RepID=UPI003F64D9E1
MGEEGAVCLDVLTNGVSENENLTSELKRDHQYLLEEDEAEEPLFPNKKQAKEVSNEDIRSEVSNPNTCSPKQNGSTSVQEFTSQSPALGNGNENENENENGSNNQVECGEVTSTCLGSSNSSSSSDDTLSHHGDNDNDNDNDTSHDADETSRVVMEIPKDVRSTGIRKITFKFSKRREDYDNQSCASMVSRPETNGVANGMSYGVHFERDYSVAMIDSGRGMVESTYGKEYLGPRKSGLGSSNNEFNVSEKVVPTNVKKLLATGILDGARVKYVSTSGKIELQGMINGGGYLCSCSSCDFSRVLSAYEFEQHAGVKTRHPNNHIYLENGRPIYSIIQELKTAPLSILDQVIKDSAGSSVNEEFFQLWKESLQQSDGKVIINRNYNRKLPLLLHSHMSPAFEESVSPASCSFVQNNYFERKMYMKEAYEEQKYAMKKPNSYVSSSITQQKKTTDGGTRKRDNDLHRLLFMPNGLPDGAELAYYVKGQKILGGYKQGNGIVCGCCDREISPSQFEAHAGMAARRQPYRHIYISNGLTLHDIAISLASGQNLTTGGSDDMCAVCGDGGDLIACDRCPRSFHAACLDLECVPEGDWHCPNCIEKPGPGRKSAAGESSSLVRPIVIRLTRVVKAPESEYGGCVVCRAHDFSVAKFDERTVMLCDQCEREFHVGCLRDSGLCNLEELPKDKWFCCDDCDKIHVALQNSVSHGTETVPASLFNIISNKHVDKGLFIDGDANDVQWQIMSGKSRYPEHLPLLSTATSIFRECFDPIIAKSGRDLIPVMVYGRNISGQEFGGMYCVVLIVKSVVVSAGLLRIFGREVAELPLVATSREHQGKGYFQALFSCIERLLVSMDVQNLVLPAAEDAESIWTKKLGFRKMSEERLSKYLREVQLTIFKGTAMLEKAVQQIME